MKGAPAQTASEGGRAPSINKRIYINMKTSETEKPNYVMWGESPTWQTNNAK